MNINIENNNFLKILLSIIEHGTYSQRELIKCQLQRLNLTFHELLEEKGHELYHLCYCKRCCQCGPIDEVPDIITLRKDKYFKLFQEDGIARLHNHNQMRQHAKCCNYVNTSANVDDIDLALANTILIHCCHELLWHCCLNDHENTLEDFLNKNKHAIFHMWSSDRPCRLCSNGIQLEVKGRIKDSEWYLLFNKSMVGDDPSVYFAHQTITTSDLNTNLSYLLLQELSEEVKISKQLRKFRNFISHHPSCRINSGDFEQKWSEIEKSLLHLAQIYGKEAEVRQSMCILKSIEIQQNIDSLLTQATDIATDIELDSKLNDVWIVMDYNTEPSFTREDLKEFVDNLSYEMTQQRRVVYERKSSKEIQNKSFQIQGQRKGITFQLDKSSVKFKTENNPIQTAAAYGNFEQRIVRFITSFPVTMTDTTERENHNQPIAIHIRLNDPQETRVEYSSSFSPDDEIVNIRDPEREEVMESDPTVSTVRQSSVFTSETPPGEEIIYIRVPERKEVLVLDPGDTCKCGKCQAVFTSIPMFLDHKMTHTQLPSRGKKVKLTVNGISAGECEEMIAIGTPKQMRFPDKNIDDQSDGSLVIWTRMSTKVFRTKDVFLTAIEQVFKELFSKSPADINRTEDVTIDVTIEDDTTADYDVNEEDIFRCGICSKEFCVIDAFLSHKKSVTCRRQSNTLPSVTTISDHYQVVEYNIDAFSSLKNLHQDLNRCLTTEEIKGEILIDLRQHPRAVIYNVYSNVDSFYLYNHHKAESMVSHVEINTAVKNGIPVVYICVLRAEYGHLTSIDIKCLQKIRTELPGNWIEKTLFVVTATSFSGLFRNYHTLSNEISKELGLKMSNITFRIFKDKDGDIFSRMSVYLENHLVENHNTVYNNIYSLKLKVEEAIQHTESHSFATSLRELLLAGPLGVKLLKILTEAARSYQWNGQSITYNKFTVSDAQEKISNHACKVLGKEIVHTVIQHLQDQLKSGSHDVFGVLFKHIDLKDFETTILKSIVLVLISIFLGPIGWLVSAVVIWFSGTDINGYSFRDEIAGKMYAQINQNIEKIIPEIVDKFRSDIVARYKDLHKSVTHSSVEFMKFFNDERDLIIKRNIENEFRMMAGKNNLIRNFKFEHNVLTVYAKGDLKNCADVKDFVDTYFRRDIFTQVVVG